MGFYSIIPGLHQKSIDGGITLSRYFIFEEFKPNDIVEIHGGDAHHIINVVRCKKGDELEISNGKDLESTVVIENIDYKNCIVTSKVTTVEKKREITPKITLFQGLPKGDKIDFILQKNTEIGVTKFVPVITERTIVKLSDKKAKKRLKRWAKIVKEASKQCMRIDIPKVKQPISFNKAVSYFKDYDLVLIPWEQEKKVSVRKTIENLDKSITNIAVLIGPEGGFSVDEVELAKRFGAVPVTLGPRILRTETAGIVISSLLLYELGDLGG